MVDRLLGVCLVLLAAALAIYVAVRLIESVAAALVAIAAGLGGVLIVGFAARLLWRWHRINRW